MSGTGYNDNHLVSQALGIEHSDWSGEFRCGSSVQASCRDLARAAQFLLNDGFLPGAGQLADRAYMAESSRAPCASPLSRKIASPPEISCR